MDLASTDKSSPPVTSKFQFIPFFFEIVSAAVTKIFVADINFAFGSNSKQSICAALLASTTLFAIHLVHLVFRFASANCSFALAGFPPDHNIGWS